MGNADLLKNVNAVTAGRAAQLKIITPEVGDFFVLLELHADRLARLKELNLSGCDLATLPAEVGKLTSLTTLDLSDNQLTTLPEALGNLKALTTLYLYNNQLTTLPEAVGKLTALTRLGLGFNQLAMLPEALGKLTSLTTLDLSNNHLTTLPEALGNLKALTTLHVSNNRLKTLPEAMGKLKALTTLYLHSNQLKTLPEALGNLKALTTLHVSNNQLTTLPEAVCNLNGLTTLELYSNQIKTFPEAVGKLTALKSLALGNNLLTLLPEGIGRLSALHALFLESNRLSALPIGLRDLDGLRWLFLHDNEALGIPPELLGSRWSRRSGHSVEEVSDPANPPRPADILNYYFEKRAAAEVGTLQPIYEIKVMLVGRGGAGKTSLRRFFLGQDHDPKEPETPGIALNTFERACGTIAIKIHLWDFAGQEITHALHQFFLTQGSVYVLVLDPRSNTEMADAFYWLDQLSRFAPGAPVVVALNRQDARQGGYDVDRDQLKERYPQIRAFVKTECSKRVGCDELLSKLYEVIAAQSKDELPWMEVPDSWLAVKSECWKLGNRDGNAKRFESDPDTGVLRRALNALTGSTPPRPAQAPPIETKHKLTFKEFQALCSESRITEPSKQESLARILHRLGAVLHFVDDPRLRDTSVLNPHWVTDGVYRLIRAKDKPKSDGVLTLGEAANALADTSIESAKFLLRLMERFEMCYPVDEDGGEAREGKGESASWLIPGSLGQYQPEGLGEQWRAPSGPGAVRLRYDYRSPVAEGIIPRFIVLTHALRAKDDAVWRNGVVLRDGEAAALVRVRRGDAPNYVEVAALGPPAARLRLLEVVQGAMDRINADLPGMPPTIEKELEGLPDDAGGVYKAIADLRAAEVANAPIIVGTTPPPVSVEPTPQLDTVSERSTREQTAKPLRTFLSYSHDDRAAKSKFVTNLNAMQGKKLITAWHDGMIEPGTEWKKEIETHLESMDLFIGLLTNNFVVSEFIQQVELKVARERIKDRGKRDFLFVLVLVDDIALEGLDLSQYQILRPAHKAVCKHKSRKDGFNEAQKEIEKLIRGHMKKGDDDGLGKVAIGTPRSPSGGTSGVGGVTVIHVTGDYVEGGKHMRDDRRVTIGGNVTNSQVGQTLTNCANMVNQQAPGKKKDLMDALRRDVEELIATLPGDKVDEAPQIAENLENAIKQAAKDKPDRRWYSVSAEGLMEAATWVEGFSAKIGGTIKNLGSMIIPGFELPKLEQ